MQQPRWWQSFVMVGLGLAGLASAVSQAAANRDVRTGAVQLQPVQVVGSHIPRIEGEGADPTFVLGRSEIEQTGAVTLGQLLDNLPIVAGQDSNPSTNNGGNAGQTNIGLRGLTSARTLLLLNGERLLLQNVDAIPLNLIDHIEIAKDGASAIYGSDAIGGVVNVVTRRHFKGVELTAAGGTSNRADGTRTQYTATYGRTADGQQLLLGLSYRNQDPVYSRDRSASQFYYYQDYNGFTRHGGSRTGANGYYVLPVATAEQFGYGNCPQSGGGIPLSRNSTASGSNPSQDYHCFSNADSFNFNQYVYDLLPSRAFEAFGFADQNLASWMSWKGLLLLHHGTTQTVLPPEPYNAQSYGAISAQNYYNPFGIDMSQARLRLIGAGDRTSAYDTTDLDIQTGPHGIIGRFQWDLLYDFQHDGQHRMDSGQLYLPAVADAVGPSVDANTCGTSGSPVPGCTPVDFFGTPSVAQLAPLLAIDTVDTHSQQHELSMDLSGKLYDLPAGALELAAGYQYRHLQSQVSPDALEAQSSALLLQGERPLITDYSAGSSSGAYSVHELYAELGVPLLQGPAGSPALAANLGVRFSDYSDFGTTTNGKYGLEYRLSDDLLLRGLYADVFRAPTISNLYGSATPVPPSFVDPCNAPGPTAPSPCSGFPTGYFDPNSNAIIATVAANPQLQPETGYTTSFGLVMNPAGYRPLTISADYWTYSIHDTIAQITLQQSLLNCFYGETVACGNVKRAGGNSGISGGTNVIGGVEPLGNLGRLLTSGLDVAAHLNGPRTSLGRLDLAMDGTYLQKFLYTPSAVQPTYSLAGLYFASPSGVGVDGYGNFPRFQLRTVLSWNLENWSAAIIDRYVSGVDEFPGLNSQGFGPAVTTCRGYNGLPGPGSPDTIDTSNGTVTCKRHVGAINYVDLSTAYRIKPWNLEVLLGVDNLGNQYKVVYSGFNDNTDPGTYDSIGRYFFARLTWRWGHATTSGQGGR